MTVLVIAAVLAAWGLAAFLVLFAFSRVVIRADEENEVSGLRRTVRAADRGAPTVPARSRWLADADA